MTTKTGKQRTTKTGKPKAATPNREIQQLIETRLRELPEDAAKDFRELATLLGQETDESERAEIAKTISEFIFPESLRPWKPEDRAGDVRAARERVAGYRRQVGAAVKRQRLNLGLTQEALAQKAKLPQSHISRLEVGKHAPTFTTMQKLAKALDTTPSRLDPGFSD